MRSERFYFYEDLQGRKVTLCEMTTEQNNVFRGKAICSPDDVYDKGYGMTLALDRAKSKQLCKIMKNLEIKRKNAYAEAARLTNKYHKVTMKWASLLD